MDRKHIVGNVIKLTHLIICIAFVILAYVSMQYDLHSLERRFFSNCAYFLIGLWGVILLIAPQYVALVAKKGNKAGSYRLLGLIFIFLAIIRIFPS